MKKAYCINKKYSALKHIIVADSFGEAEMIYNQIYKDKILSIELEAERVISIDDIAESQDNHEK